VILVAVVSSTVARHRSLRLGPSPIILQFLSTVTGKRNFGVTMSDPSFKFPIHPVRAGGYSLGKSALDMLSNLNNYFKFPSSVMLY
jgi:hypothetical protein